MEGVGDFGDLEFDLFALPDALMALGPRVADAFWRSLDICGALELAFWYEVAGIDLCVFGNPLLTGLDRLGAFQVVGL